MDVFHYVRFDDVEKTGRVPIYSILMIIKEKSSTELFDCVSILSEETVKPVSLPKFSALQSESPDEGKGLKRYNSILAYDGGWWNAASTENHSLSQTIKLLPLVPGVIYFGFPWAMLFEKLNAKDPTADLLQKILDTAKPLIASAQKYIITVCQHIHMLKYHRFFAESGVTHVFWSHAIKGQHCFPGYREIKIFPFPLFPGPALYNPSSMVSKKKYLFSYIGTRSNERCLTQSRSMIVDHLSNLKRSFVYSADKRKFINASSDHRIQTQADFQQEFIERFDLKSIKRIMQESIFTLCPSGLGPNSTYLWESIWSGSIPVVLSNVYLPPGNQSLWQAATVSCSERLENILALPDRLDALARDDAQLDQKRRALHQLWLLYGPDCFIYDIQKLFLSLAEENFDMDNARPDLSYGKLLNLAAAINQRKNVQESELDLFILGCSSRVLSDPTGFLNCYEENAEFHMAYKEAISSCNRRYSEAMLRNLEFRGISLK